MTLSSPTPILRIFDEAKGNGSALRIQTDDVTGLNRELLQKTYTYARPDVESTPWGTREMAIADPSATA